MVEVKTALVDKVKELLIANGYPDVKIYPKNQVAQKAKYPYIIYDFTIIGKTGRNTKESLFDLSIIAKNNADKQEEAELIADIFSVEGEGFENDTIITPTNELALEMRMNSRATPETQREKLKRILMTHNVKIIDSRTAI